MVEPTHKGMQVLTHLVFYIIILHYNFGIRKFNIIHCKLRNEASNLKAHLFNDFLSDKGIRLS
jgi:antibiotic biosynthesis monooxygenase (ABM) superfamily enzyme